MNKKNLADIYRRIDGLLNTKDKIIIAIEGNSAAGKSTLALLISNIYDCNLFHMDDYFLQPELKTEERLREVGGNVDYVRFKDAVIAGINSRRSFSYRAYDCKQMRLKELILVEPKKLSIIEGSYSMHPVFADNYDLKIFLQIGKKEQRNRILKRNGELMYKRYAEEWIPKENSYFFEFKIKEKCDKVY